MPAHVIGTDLERRAGAQRVVEEQECDGPSLEIVRVRRLFEGTGIVEESLQLGK
jgi:hypothetical protein